MTGVIAGTLGYEAAGPYAPVVTVSDGREPVSLGFAWTVLNTNRDPVADADTLVTGEDTPLLIAIATDLLGNDADVDGDSLSISGFTPPANGSVVDNGDGTFTYTPNADFFGPDAFTYTLSDGNGGSATGSVTVTVSTVNDVPVANTDDVVTPEDVSVTVMVLANDSDPDGDALSVTGASQGASGTVTVNPDATVTYVPQANFNGADSFTYTLSDGSGGTSTASVAVIVEPTNDAPSIVSPGDQVHDEGDAVSVVVQASDVDGDSLSYSATGLPPDLVIDPVTGHINGSLGYETAGGYAVVVTVSDGVEPVHVSFGWTVTDINRAPVAGGDADSTPEDTAVTVTVLTNDSDPDGDALSVTGASQGASGTVTVNPDATLTYIPQANFNGPDSFTYTLSDGRGASATGSVAVTVTPVNDAPVVSTPIADQTATPHVMFSFQVPATTFGDVDESDVLELRASGAGGDALPMWLVFDALTGRFGGTPGAADVGTVRIAVTATDTGYLSASVEFNLTVADSSALIGTELADTLLGTEGPDIIDGRAGDDLIFGYGGDDILQGGAGADTLYGGDGADVLDGGAGDDTLDGGVGDDVYLFGRGAGQDVVSDTDWTVGNLDVVGVAADVLPAELMRIREGDDLVLSIVGTTDVLTLRYWFLGTEHRVERVEFADGTVWDEVVLAATPTAEVGTEGDDTLYGMDGEADVLQGLGGNDMLYGYGGDDTLSGGAGADTVHGGDGADVLDGGAGDDTLDGEAGNDVYLFGRGAGQDRVSDYDPTVGNVDVVRVAADVVPAELIPVREGDDLVLSIVGTTDAVTLDGWFLGTEHRVERVEFADGTVWDEVIIGSQVVSPPSGLRVW